MTAQIRKAFTVLKSVPEVRRIAKGLTGLAVAILVVFAVLLIAVWRNPPSKDSGATKSSPPKEIVAVESHPEDTTALNILKLPELWGPTCEKIKDAKVVERIRGTASANNHPAYVVGYQFVCVDSVAGNKMWLQYVGWMENTDTQRLQCIHHNQERNRVVGEGWHSCGGNFKSN
ncbi:hypothetical protein QTI24_00010 [Variovorax sp. J22P240]|uniref:hypothetical protein n=1 Tax=Variovorax sp. J22P240 TaxID=3053514 RepID=UPI0025760D3C|nr:hypothetical protein [Variovorax sp. J22P240]MDL9996965.1 hypothetical protein [Variovorax sp. J22P240]